MKTSLPFTLALLATAGLLAGTTSSLLAADPQPASSGSADTTTLKGEVVDLVCYTAMGASGEKHADCAKKCISAGNPVGLKAEDGKTYVLVGDHKPMNAELVEYAAKTITVRGKVASRDGVNMLQNAEIVK